MTEDTNSEEYKYRLDLELGYLRNEIKEHIGEEQIGEELTDLVSLKIARDLIRQYVEQQTTHIERKILSENLDHSFEKLKNCLKYYSALRIEVPETVSLSELIDLAVRAIDTNHSNNVKLVGVIRRAMDSLSPIELATPHMTKNQWQFSKDGIVQALTMTLCGEVRECLRRSFKEYERFYQSPDEF